MRTNTRACTSSSWEDTLNVSTGDKSDGVKERTGWEERWKLTFMCTVHVCEVKIGEILCLSRTGIFTVIQTEAEGLGEGHTHRLPQWGSQERGEAWRLGSGRGGTGAREMQLTSCFQMVILRLQVLHRWLGHRQVEKKTLKSSYTNTQMQYHLYFK